MDIKELGFIRVASAIPTVHVADCSFNAAEISSMIDAASTHNVSIICFPELCITGYTCQDLFLNRQLISSAEVALHKIVKECEKLNIVGIVGCPIEKDGALYNCAVVFSNGHINAIIPKTFIPNYKEFYEKRWFTSGLNINETITINGDTVPFSSNIIINYKDRYFDTPCKIGIEICEDMWAPIPPSSYLALNGAEIIFNLSGSNDIIGKHNYLCNLIQQQSARCIAGYVYSSCGWGESTSDLVFGGNAIIYENGSLLEKSKRFSIEPQMVFSDIDIDNIRNERLTNKTFADNSKISKVDIVEVDIDMSKYFTNIPVESLSRFIKGTPFVPSDNNFEERCKEIITIQAEGLARRIQHTNSKKVVIGVSGGLDSTLALLVACKSMDILERPHSDIVGITMPCFGTTKRTKNNSIDLMNALGVTAVEIDISAAVNQHFKDIEHEEGIYDITYENCQARERTQVLMDYGNKVGGFVLGTGDLSELALGWCTYNADHMSMYNVNVSIPKTLVKYLVRYFSIYGYAGDSQVSSTLLDILDTPVSPELLPPTEDGQIAQVTEDKIGPYILHDFFLYNFVRKNYSIMKIYQLACIADFGTDEFGNDIVFDKDTIKKWLKVFVKRFFNQQFKRNCLPDGPKVGTVSLSPRGDWRMPADACNGEWIFDIDTIN